jgi:large subunit ribosomal protein L21
MDFAIIETGGKQYKVAKGDTLLVEKLPGEHKDGDTITFENVLLVGSDKDAKVGTPFVSGSKVTAVFNGDGKGKKTIVERFRSKSRYHVKRGHRQPHSSITISDIK